VLGQLVHLNVKELAWYAACNCLYNFAGVISTTILGHPAFANQVFSDSKRSGRMNGFHAGGHEEAERALREEHKERLDGLMAKLRALSTGEVSARQELENEIARCREVHRKAVAALDGCLF
jgi:hypothetical protein